MTVTVTDCASTERVSNLKALNLKAMEDAARDVMEARAKKEREREEARTLFIKKAPERADEIIASIPKRIRHATKSWLENGGPYSSRAEGFNCDWHIMVLDPLESSEDPNDGTWKLGHQPSSACLRHAAKTVFDFCADAGLHPRLVRGGRLVPTGAEVYCFLIQIRWDIPHGLMKW